MSSNGKKAQFGSGVPGKPSSVPGQVKPAARQSSPQSTAPVVTKEKSYGIEDAIRLMKRLPSGDMKILAQVIKETLESTQIQVIDIIRDAERKEEHLEASIHKLDAEIEDLEIMINQRKETIHALLTDLEETRQVKHDLAMADSKDIGAPKKTEGLRSKAAMEYAEKLRDHSKVQYIEDTGTALSLDDVDDEADQTDEANEAAAEDSTAS